VEGIHAAAADTLVAAVMAADIPVAAEAATAGEVVEATRAVAAEGTPAAATRVVEAAEAVVVEVRTASPSMQLELITKKSGPYCRAAFRLNADTTQAWPAQVSVEFDLSLNCSANRIMP
jgi:hypothetical protein